MLSILKMLSTFSGSGGPDGPDLPSPIGRKFQLSGLTHTVSVCIYKGGWGYSDNLCLKYYQLIRLK